METKDRNSYMKDLSDILNDLTLDEEENSKSSNAQNSKKNTVSVRSPNSSKSMKSVTGGTLTSEEHSLDKSDASYTSDFSNDSETTSEIEMTAWEKWFVMKQEQIRKITEADVKSRVEEINKNKHQEYLQKRKMKESKENMKIWLERKKREKMEEEKNLQVKPKRIINNPEYTFQSWYLRKCREKKIDLLLKEYQSMKEKEEKKNKLKQNKKAVKKWMSQVKCRPRKLKTISASWGGSSISEIRSNNMLSLIWLKKLQKFSKLHLSEVLRLGEQLTSLHSGRLTLDNFCSSIDEFCLINHRDIMSHLFGCVIY